MSDIVETNTRPLEAGNEESSEPSSKKLKTESTIEVSQKEITEQESEQKVEKDIPSQCSTENSEEGNEINSSTTSSKQEDENDNNCNQSEPITTPDKKPEFENELSLFYEELGKIENETIDESADGSTICEQSSKSSRMDHKRTNNVDRKCEHKLPKKPKTTSKGAQLDSTGRYLDNGSNEYQNWSKSEITSNEHSQSVHWNKIGPLSRAQQTQAQAFIGPLGPPLPRFNMQLNYQRSNVPPVRMLPYSDDGRFLNRGLSSSEWNSASFASDNRIRITSQLPFSDYSPQLRHTFHDYGPEHRTKFMSSRTSSLYQHYQQPEELLRLRNMWYDYKVLIFMRGPPGSGKTTLSQDILAQNPGGVVLTTDDYFCRGGSYWFDSSLLGEAHEWNQKRAKQVMDEGVTPVIIDNTNIQAWEMKPYVEMAADRDYRVDFQEPETWWKFDVSELEKRNKHRVPREKIIQMMERFEHPISSEIVLNSTEPPHTNKNFPKPPPNHSQRQAKMKKKSKIPPALNVLAEGKCKKKPRRHRKPKIYPSQMSERAVITHYPTRSEEHDTSECEGDISEEEHSAVETKDLGKAMRNSQGSFGAVDDKAICQTYEDEHKTLSALNQTNSTSVNEPFHTRDYNKVVAQSIEPNELDINTKGASVIYGHSSQAKSVFLTANYQKLDQAPKNLPVVITVTNKEPNLAAVMWEHPIVRKEQEDTIDNVHFEIGAVFKEYVIEYVAKQENMNPPVSCCSGTQEEIFIELDKGFSISPLEGNVPTACMHLDWPIETADKSCEPRQKRDRRPRRSDLYNKMQDGEETAGAKWMVNEPIKQNTLTVATSCQDASSSDDCQGDVCDLKLPLPGNMAQDASTRLSSQMTEHTAEDFVCDDRCFNEIGKESSFTLQSSNTRSSMVELNYIKKPRRFCRLAPSFQLPRQKPMDTEESKRKECSFTKDVKLPNDLFHDALWCERASVNLDKGMLRICPIMQKNIHNSEFVNRSCETIEMNQINDEAEEKDSQESGMLVQEASLSSNKGALKKSRAEHMENSYMLLDFLHGTDYAVSPCMDKINEQNKVILSGKPVSVCLPFANIKRSSEDLLAGSIDSRNIQKESTNSSQTKSQPSSSFCTSHSEYEFDIKSKDGDEQEAENNPFLELQLSHEFASQLIELFGSPGIDPDFLLPEDCNVRLDRQVAKMIHSQWKTSVEVRLNEIPSMDDASLKDVNEEIKWNPDNETKESSTLIDLHHVRRLSSDEDWEQTDKCNLFTHSSNSQFTPACRNVPANN